MAPVAAPSEADHFSEFKVFDVTYKVVHDHPIQASVLVPRRSCKGPRPVIVRFHGGGLVRAFLYSDSRSIHIPVQESVAIASTCMSQQSIYPSHCQLTARNQVSGTRLHPPWFPSYLLTHALAHSALIVSPDYRLLPEARGIDILSDVASLWSWVFASLHSLVLRRDPLGTPTGVDLGRILVTGESAGGWLALQSAFAHPARVCAVLGVFPMLDLGDEHFSRRRAGAGASNEDKAGIMGLGTLLDEAIVDAYVAAAQQAPRRVVSSVSPPERMELSLAAFQHGRVGELLGAERALYPLWRVEELGRAGVRLPPLLIVHGADDSVVPVEGSRRFVRAWKTWQPLSRVRLVLRPGEHGFEAGARAEEKWLGDALEWVADAWLNEGGARG